MFGWLSLFFQPIFMIQFRKQLHFYTQDKAPSYASQLILSVWFVVCFCFLKSKIAGIDSWKLPHFLYPQIDFSHIKLFDPLRMSIQTVWFLIVQPKKLTGTISLTQGIGMVWKQIGRLFYLPLKGLTFVVSWLESYSSRHAIVSKEKRLKNPSLSTRVLNVAIGFVVCVLAILCFTIPFSLTAQAFFLVALWSLGMMFRRMPGRFPDRKSVV